MASQHKQNSKKVVSYNFYDEDSTKNTFQEESTSSSDGASTSDEAVSLSQRQPEPLNPNPVYHPTQPRARSAASSTLSRVQIQAPGNGSRLEGGRWCESIVGSGLEIEAVKGDLRAPRVPKYTSFVSEPILDAEQESAGDDDSEWNSSKPKKAEATKWKATKSARPRRADATKPRAKGSQGKLCLQPSDDPNAWFESRSRKLGESTRPGFMPVFGSTKQVEPLYDETGRQVELDINGDFEMTVLHPYPSVPRIHMLFRRNYFSVTNCSYTFDRSSTQGSRLKTMGEDEGVLQEVQKMFIRLKAKLVDGDDNGKNAEITIYTNSKREEAVKVPKIPLRPQRRDPVDNESLYYPESTGDGSELPDCYTFHRLGFRRATSNPKPSEANDKHNYYTLFLQLVSLLPDGTRVVNAQRETTELMKAGGRSPGSRSKSGRYYVHRRKMPGSENPKDQPVEQPKRGRGSAKKTATLQEESPVKKLKHGRKVDGELITPDKDVPPSKKLKPGRDSNKESTISDEVGNGDYTTRDSTIQENSIEWQTSSSAKMKDMQSDTGSSKISAEAVDAAFDEHNEGERICFHDITAFDQEDLPEEYWQRSSHAGGPEEQVPEPELERRQQWLQDLDLERRQRHPQQKTRDHVRSVGAEGPCDGLSKYSDSEYFHARDYTEHSTQELGASTTSPALPVFPTSVFESFGFDAHHFDVAYRDQLRGRHGSFPGQANPHSQLAPQNRHCYLPNPQQSIHGRPQQPQPQPSSSVPQPEPSFSLVSAATSLSNSSEWSSQDYGFASWPDHFRLGLSHLPEDSLPLQGSNASQYRQVHAEDGRIQILDDAMALDGECLPPPPDGLPILEDWAAQYPIIGVADDKANDDAKDEYWLSLVNLQD